MATKSTTLAGTTSYGDSKITSGVSSTTKGITNKIMDLKDQSLSVASSTSSNIRSGVAYVSEKTTKFNKVVSDYKSEALSGINAKLGAVSNNFLKAEDLTNLTAINKYGKVELTPDSLISKIGKECGLTVRGMESLNTDIANSLFNNLNKDSGGLLGKIANINGTELEFDLTKALPDDIQNMIDIFKRLGNSEYDNYKDANLTNTFNKYLLEDSVNMGFIEGIQSAYDLFTTTESAQSALLKVMETVIDVGNFHVLKKFKELMTEQTIEATKFKYPDLAINFLYRFRFTNKDISIYYEEIATELKALLILFSGDKFWLKSTEYGDILNLTISANISNDVRILFSEDEDFLPLICAKGLFIEREAIETFRSDFPKAVFIS